MFDNNIWNELKKEFGSNAYLRVCDDYSEFSGNDDIEELQRLDSGIELKPLPELFAHDVQFYGENAYLMWSWSRVLGCNRCLANNSDFNNIEYATFKRKNSAALPFDLERAKKGDAVQFITPYGVLININFVSVADMMSEVAFLYGNKAANIKNFFMQYPKKL